MYSAFGAQVVAASLTVLHRVHLACGSACFMKDQLILGLAAGCNGRCGVAHVLVVWCQASEKEGAELPRQN